MTTPNSAAASLCDAIDLSLIICTRDRASALEQCLVDLDTAAVNEAHGEVVLVDNGSSDGTPRVMRRFADEAPCRVNIVVEPDAGLSRARNAGLARAQGDTIVFTDDDCYLGPDYFKVAHAVFDDSLFSYCGGRILLYDSEDAAYGLSEIDTFEQVPPHSFIPPGRFQGANLVVHRRVFDQIGAFDVELGAGTPFRCEDVDFVARASRAGFTGAYVPELVVYHHHGRKPGQEIEHLKSKNAYARGAYYAKFLTAGYPSYAWYWLRCSLLRRRSLFRTWPSFMREVRGGIDYLTR